MFKSLNEETLKVNCRDLFVIPLIVKKRPRVACITLLALQHTPLITPLSIFKKYDLLNVFFFSLSRWQFYWYKERINLADPERVHERLLGPG